MLEVSNELIVYAKSLVLKNESISSMTDEKLKLYINKVLLTIVNDNKLSLDYAQILEVSNQIFYRIRGLGILENLLLDDNISEIMVNDSSSIYIEKNGLMKKLNVSIESLDEYNRIIQKIVSRSGREVNLSNPIVDARLEDGSRVNIVLPPISKNEPIVTIRKFPKRNIDMDFLINSGTISADAASFVKKLVRAKFNILIGGGTSSGKTTFLNAITEYIDCSERIITIEDSRELQIFNKDNLLSLETRNSNNSNKGLIDIGELIKNSLRMRPDRLIVGEVRSAEAVDMLTALNTGHEGGLTTAHANSCNDMISRLETMVLRADNNIPIEAVKRMIASSIEVIIQLSRIDMKKRRVVEISEIYYKDFQILTNKLYEYSFEEDQLIRTSNRMINNKKIENYEVHENQKTQK